MSPCEQRIAPKEQVCTYQIYKAAFDAFLVYSKLSVDVLLSLIVCCVRSKGHRLVLRLPIPAGVRAVTKKIVCGRGSIRRLFRRNADQGRRHWRKCGWSIHCCRSSESRMRSHRLRARCKYCRNNRSGELPSSHLTRSCREANCSSKPSMSLTGAWS